VFVACWFWPPAALSQSDVTAQVQIEAAPKAKKPPDLAGVVVWLEPLYPDARPAVPRAAQPLRLVQEDKSFQPHLLIIPERSTVEFPNEDPFFHNVFSLFNGKRFDLGLYEAGSTRRVTFDRPGICYIFCNIHPEMSAVIIVMDTPYYGVSDARGQIAISGVPPGRYNAVVWQERADPDALRGLSREVTITPGAYSLGTLRLREAHLLAHKNKYGTDYDTSTPPNSIYVRP
jgi:plastocyanin